MPKKLTQQEEDAIREAVARLGSKRAASLATGFAYNTVDRVVGRDPAPASPPGAVADLVALGVAQALRQLGVGGPAAEPYFRAAQGSEARPAPAAEVPPEIDGLALLVALRKRPMTAAEVAEKAGCSEAEARAWVASKQAEGVNLVEAGGTFSVEKTPPLTPYGQAVLEIESDDDDTFTIGAMGDTHLCFPPNTPIHTDRGDVRIARIKPGDMVLTHKGRYRPVREVVVSPGTGEFVRVRFCGKAAGGKSDKASLVCTPNHPVLVVRDGAEGWVPAGEIRPGDAVRGTGKKCRDCDAMVPVWNTVCESCDPFVREGSSRGKKAQRQEQASRTSGCVHYRRDIVPEMGEWSKNGWRVIPVERVRPDFIAIKDGKVVAVEVEAPPSGRPRPVYEKYEWDGTRDYYDDVVWVEKDPRTKLQNRLYGCLPANADGLIAFVVSSVETFKTRPTGVYNLIVEEDESYVAKRCAVHNCSKYERLDVLNALYDQYVAEGVRHVFHTGNWIDGEARFNRHDLKVHGMDAQLRYLAEQYPARPGVHTYAVAGDDHEGWYCQREGVDIGRYAEMRMRDAGRADWTNLGYMEGFVKLVNRRSGQSAMLLVVHPGGGSAYALSYTIQKLVESYAGGEKPAALFAGHYHKMELANFRGVWCVQTGCTQDQTPFMRKKRLEAHVGGHVVRFKQDPRTGSLVEMNGMKRFWNVGYYNNRWSMSGPVVLPRRTLGGVA